MLIRISAASVDILRDNEFAIQGNIGRPQNLLQAHRQFGTLTRLAYELIGSDSKKDA